MRERSTAAVAAAGGVKEDGVEVVGNVGWSTTASLVSLSCPLIIIIIIIMFRQPHKPAAVIHQPPQSGCINLLGSLSLAALQATFEVVVVNIVIIIIVVHWESRYVL